MDILDILLSATFWTAAVRIASPLIFATMGELICERAGVLNLGIEGIMVAGAFAGWMAVYAGTGLWTGVAIAMLCGMGFGLIHGLLTVPFVDIGVELQRDGLPLGCDFQVAVHRSNSQYVGTLAAEDVGDAVANADAA